MPKKIKKSLVFGSDPEFFSAYEENGQLYVLPPVVLRDDYGVSFEDNGRHPIFAHYGDTIVHEDGGAFEMSTPPVSDWRNMWSTLHDVRDSFGKDILSKYPDVCLPTLFSLPAMNWQVERWMYKGSEFEMATQFGCDPDEDVFDTKSKCKVIDASLHPWRYAGGHIHISGIPEIEKYPLQGIKSMVLTAGLASTAYSDVPDLERERLFLYGKPGKFRIQHYPDGQVGIEYRTCSTRWTESYDLAEKVFSWAEIAMKNLLQKNLLKDLEPVIMEDAKKAILSVDQNSARQLLDFIASKV
jgi:hypothetical protein